MKTILRLFTVFILFFLFIQNAFNQCAPLSNMVYPSLGGNLGFLSYWGEDRVFVNRVANGEWRTTSWGTSILDEEGWPIDASILMMASPSGTDPLGFLKRGSCMMRFTGKAGVVTATGSGWLENFQHISTTGNTSIYSFDISESDAASSCNITFNDAVRDVEIIPTHLGRGSEREATGWTLDNYPAYDPRYNTLYEDLSAFRFMDWGKTNTNATENWEDRTPATGSQQVNTGVAYEHMVGVCNAFKKDMWVNVPTLANDEYVRNMAELIMNNLDNDLNVYVELGNEIWNFGGAFWSYRLQQVFCNRQLNAGDPDHLRGGVNNLPYDDGAVGTIVDYPYGPNGLPISVMGFGAWTVHKRSIALRLKQISEIFADVWGQEEINNRVRILLAGQHGGGQGYGYNIAEGLYYINQMFGKPKNYFYAISSAVYIPANIDGTPTEIIELLDTTIDARFSELGSDPIQGNAFAGFSGLAHYYGLNYIAYEGGPDLGWGNEFTLEKQAAKRDPRIKDIYKKLWNNWYSYGHDGLFMLFTTDVSAGYSNMYSWMEDVKDTNAYAKQAVHEITNSPAPALGGPGIHNLPTIEGDSIDIDAREVFGYSDCDFYVCAWGSADYSRPYPGNMYNHGEGLPNSSQSEDSYLVSVNTNATYIFSIDRDGLGSGNTNPNMDVSLDGDLILDDITMTYPPSTRSFNTTTTNFELDLKYGLHTFQLWYNGENGNLYTIRVKLKPGTEAPPAKPDRITGRRQICEGGENNISYSVSFDGSVCWYDWSIPAGATIVSGDSTNNITINFSAGFSGGDISVFAHNHVGDSPSESITLTTAPCGYTISENPVCINTPVTFTDETLGSESWFWTFGADASSSSDTSAGPHVITYSQPGDKSVSLRVVDGDGNTKTYSRTLVVNETIGGTTSAVPALVSLGGSSTISLTGYSGNNISWEESPDGISWSAISGTSATIDVNNILSTTRYRAVVQSEGCLTETSAEVIVTVDAPVIPGAVDSNQTICLGETPSELTLSGYTGSSFQWESSTSPGIWNIISGETGITYSPPAITETTSYRVIVSNGPGTEIASDSATITIIPIAIPGSVTPASTTIPAGTLPGNLTLLGHSGTIELWQYNVAPFTPDSWVDITNTSDTYDPGLVMEDTRYRAMVQNGSCPSTPSTEAEVIVIPNQAGIVIGGTSVCTGTNSTNLELTDYSGTILGWKYSEEPYTTEFDILEAGGPDEFYTATNLTVTTRFWAVIENGTETLNSVPATITVNQASIGGDINGPSSVLINESANLDLVNNLGTVLSWSFSTNAGITWSNIAGTAGEISISSQVITQTTLFKVEVQNGVCPSVFSNHFEIVPTGTPGILAAVAQLICRNSTAILDLTDYTGIIINWQQASYQNGIWTDILNTQSTHISDPIIENTYFRVVVETTPENIDTSNQILISLIADAEAGNLSFSNNCVDQYTGSSNLEIIGYTGNHFEWYRSDDSITFTSFGSDQNTATVSNIENELYVFAIVRNENCVGDTTNYTIIDAIASTTITGEFSVCPDGISQFYSIEVLPGYLYTFTDVIGGEIQNESTDDKIEVIWGIEEPTSLSVLANKDGTVCQISTDFSIDLIKNELEVTCPDDPDIEIDPDQLVNYQANYVIDGYELDVVYTDNNCGEVFVSNTYNNKNSLNGESINLKFDEDNYKIIVPITWSVTDIYTDEIKCSFSINAKIDLDIDPPKAFSPNGDGINDYWEIKGLSLYEMVEVMIFNRNGNMVYFNDNEYSDKPWDGTSNLRILPIDSYHYVIKVNENLLKKGNVTIIR